MTTLNKTQKTAAIKALDEKTPVAQVLTDTFAPKVSAAHHDAPDTLKPSVLTQAHKEALRRLPEVYGQVAPESPRLLTDDEVEALVDERTVIEALLSLLKSRKDTSIRETLAYHLDRVAESEGIAGPETPTDTRGHYYVKQELEVPEALRKVQRIVSDPKPVVDARMLLDLHEEGVLSREEYLSVTSVPEVARNFDEDKARKAIRKNPALMTKIAQAVTRKDPTITIKVVANSK